MNLGEGVKKSSFHELSEMDTPRLQIEEVHSLLQLLYEWHGKIRAKSSSMTPDFFQETKRNIADQVRKQKEWRENEVKALSAILDSLESTRNLSSIA